MSKVLMHTTAVITHENKSQGVQWTFTRGPRIWTERHQRFLCVGGELDGQRLTAPHIAQSKWSTFYKLYNRAYKSNPEQTIWVFLNEH